MTNYNERLDKALERLAVAGRGWGVSEDAQIASMISDLAEAKEAITSLIKELVAEAKPKTMPSNLSPENYEKCERVVNQYHQNLLKALEDV